MVVEPDIVDTGITSAAGQYLWCWYCRSSLLTFETWQEQLCVKELLRGVPTDLMLLNWTHYLRKEAMSQLGALVRGTRRDLAGAFC